MNCSNCGRPLEPDFKYCPECAVPLYQQETETIQVVQSSNAVKTQKPMLRRVLLYTMIAALSVSALLGIFIIIFGTGGMLEGKILGTTASIGGYSLLALCFSALYEKKKFTYFALAGFIACLIGFLLIQTNIWFEFSHMRWELVLLLQRLIWSFVLIPLFMTHCSLLLLITNKTKQVSYVLFATITLIAIVLVMILILFWELLVIVGETYYKSLAIFAILAVLGTIVTPILNKIGNKKN